MGQIVIKAWGSMNPEVDKDSRTVEINHSQMSYAGVFSEAHYVLDQMEEDLIEKVGLETYETDGV